ncbi:TPA: helix-turn-helix domain-containing protein [Klebsiella aerogenes]|uniref:helix-turn-helix transcriptional regulator n=1 Tax=Klebsiella aerogenes TaxID=548 RepID=UPI0021B207EF|nr:helix-turn-helix transcriptional regulator [Klebsiella aerogenes]MEC5622052.1 helix-turn-helix transcriptional regulator [Klebsiella aerogenes]WPS52230.1 helix-turn-helix transcriptional regulator [Klebsiella aerogenes]HBS0233551.1 helix-turn-helix domain-containing protein [Klebsiella aerogenes]HBU7546362.1 helix-turn-helix domain-containing protein [Klebsiella aerogenes]HBV5677043.1 helix-turn-helix domain-containing protein [Klebsiella aerogenes]
MQTAMQSLGDFLRALRLRLDPTAFGFVAGRRRTSGLRREEVAQLACISPTWYTWLEQGRGGAPSREVLNRIASGLRLTPLEREHLFILAFGHPPDAKFTISADVTPRLQRVLDTLTIPAIVKTVTWDVIAWNPPAACVLTDYGQLPREERNVLRRMFTDPVVRRAQSDWQAMARLVVNAFRADVARAGQSAEIDSLVTELSQLSPEFDAWWRSNDVTSHGEGAKRINHPQAGAIDLEFSTFMVEGRQDLNMIVFNPANEESRRKIDEQVRQFLSYGGESVRHDTAIHK